MTSIFNILAIATAALTGFLYWYGLHTYLFWYYSWYDIVMHLAGGLTVGLWVSALASRRGLSPLRALILACILAFTVGVVWEVFEYVAGLTKQEGYGLDTAKDLFDDCVGAAAAMVVYKLFYKQPEESNA